MKRFVLGLVLGAATLLAMGVYGHLITYTSSTMPRVPWHNLGSITATQASPAVNARDYSAVVALTDAKTIQWLNIVDDVALTEWRFSTTADSDADVVEVWVAADDYTAAGVEDHFTLGAILTLTGGQQVGPYGNYFVDTIVVSTSAAIQSSAAVDSAANRMCVWRADLRGWKKVVLIATTLQAATTLYAEVRWLPQ